MSESEPQPSKSKASRYLLAGIECLIWIAPIGLSAFVHVGASMKAGQRFVVDNVRTQNAEAAYYLVDSLPWVFHIYSLVVVAICIVALMTKVRLRWRCLILLALSVPVIWYLPKASFLMGKFIDW